MDLGTLATALKQTLDPNLSQQAEKLLNEASRLPNFVPYLLQITLDEGCENPLRQAAAVYLKNTVVKYWKEREAGELEENEEVPFCIEDASKAVLREHIVKAIIQTPPSICRQLCVCLEQVVRHDFPEKWTGLVSSVTSYLTSDNQATWLGSLLALEQLAKKYKFKKTEERKEYIEAMQVLLPILYQRTMAILSDHSVPSVSLQHHILKIFYASMQYTLSLEIMNDNTLPGWMFVFQTIVQRPVPAVANEVDEDDRPELEWWKCKKWALRILERFVYRYGKPGSTEKQYRRFAQYYTKTFSAGVNNVMLKQLEVKRLGEYVSPRVLQIIFNYFLEIVDVASMWKLMEPHFMEIFRSIIFPMMCYSEEDDQLWKDDPYEYIRMKFDIFEDLISPTVAATSFLARACEKRKVILDPVMSLCIQVLDTPTNQRDPSKKDGALHVIGQVSSALIRKKKYAQQLESMLVTHVFPEFQNPLGYMRARACWMIHFFSEIDFKDCANLKHALEQVVNCLTMDNQLPVKVEAAVALQYLIKHQREAETYIQPHVKPIIKELLVVIKETQNDDLTSVMQELIETYGDQMADVAVSLCQELVGTFNEIVDPTGQSTDEDSYKALAALGILSALQSLVKATFNEAGIVKSMETVVLPMVVTMLQNGVIDFYEEMFNLVDLFTTSSVSTEMWQVFPILYETFSKDGFDYFTDIMCALYNFVKVGTAVFLSNPGNVEAVVSMCKAVMAGDSGEDPQVHACKLLEVVLLECRGSIDNFIPGIMAIVFERLTLESKTTELKTMCILVVIAGLYYNTGMVLELLENTRFPDSSESITKQFFREWVKDIHLFAGVHDRKMSVLGLCAVLSCPLRPQGMLEVSGSIIPAAVSQLEGLQEAYKEIADDAAAEADDSGGSMADEEDKEEEEETDEEEEAGSGNDHKLTKKSGDGDEEDDEDDDDDLPQTLMELDYETSIDEDEVDEFGAFKAVLQELSANHVELYSSLVVSLTSEIQSKIEKLFMFADQRKAHRDSQAIEVAGGYKFAVTAVPNNFVFGPS